MAATLFISSSPRLNTLDILFFHLPSASSAATTSLHWIPLPASPSSLNTPILFSLALRSLSTGAAAATADPAPPTGPPSPAAPPTFVFNLAGVAVPDLDAPAPPAAPPLIQLYFLPNPPSAMLAVVLALRCSTSSVCPAFAMRSRSFFESFCSGAMSAAGGVSAAGSAEASEARRRFARARRRASSCLRARVVRAARAGARGEVMRIVGSGGGVGRVGRRGCWVWVSERGPGESGCQLW